ncbi:putative FERM domain-containing protein FRMD8P1 isoform X2 [Acanthaster planci]|uniref:FERM domain-containing protein 8 n=1 Tax=Acanthaster planci TaxID=133434 RepID=A0A8B7XYE4_ACAPL|nr:putative FERM domain-containing protein FRMD8P1 isoform X2 [Acanthaster planci]
MSGDVIGLSRDTECVQMREISGRSGMMQRQRQQQWQQQQQQSQGPLSPVGGVQRLGSTISTRSIKAVDVCVFLKDGTGHEFFLENALVETAGDIMKRMQEHLGLPEVASEVFFLWITSPLLQLQLKSHHIPFKLCRKWHDLLDKFTTAKEEQKANDEPMLYFQRNVFFPKAKEAQITDQKVLRLLYEEAKCNILQGNYPCEPEDFEYLAGIIAYAENGKYDPDQHPAGFLKTPKPVSDNASSSSIGSQTNQVQNLDSLHRYLPACMCKGGSRWIKNKGGFPLLEQRVMAAWDDISGKVRSKRECHQHLLDFCWKLPFYGCVFFTGQIERVSSPVTLRDTKDRPVHIGINKEAVFIIDIAKQDIILGLTYDELSWEYTEPARDNPGCMPCLWLEFDSEEGGKRCSKVLQIFSRQAVMMNAMIEASVEELNKLDLEGKHRSKTVMDGLMRVAMEASAPVFGILPVKAPKTAVSNKMDRLCLSTFSEKGELISRKARGARRPFSLTNFFRTSDQR